MFRTERGELIIPADVRLSNPEPLGYRCLVSLEKVPQLVDEVLINPCALELLPKEYAYLASTDYWRETVCLTVPIDRREKVIKSPLSFGRAVPLGYGRIPFGDFVGGTIMGKGCFRSGRYFSIVVSDSNMMMPIGIFGSKDAEMEVLIANELLRIGYRSSLPLATVIFNAGMMEDFLLERWRRSDFRHDITKCFQILKHNGDEPVFLGRVCGVLRRQNDNSSKSNNLKIQLGWAAELLLDEMRVSGNHFGQYLRNDGLNVESIGRVLEKVSYYRRLNVSEFEQYLSLLKGIVTVNSKALEAVDFNSHLSRYNNLPSILAARKDNCLAGYSMDYEELCENGLAGISYGPGAHAVSRVYMDEALARLKPYEDEYRGILSS